MTLRRSMFLRLVFVVACWGICILTGYLIWAPTQGEANAVVIGGVMAAIWHMFTSALEGI